jgi:hypothetical protein
MNDPRRQTWSGLGLEGRRLCPASASCSIGEPLPFGTNDRQIGTRHVIDPELDPIGIAEIEFGQIPVQMGFAHMLTD